MGRMPVSVFLQNVERFGPITEEERQAIQGAAERRSWVAARADLAPQGEATSESTLILSGFAYRAKHLSDGRRQITAVHIPGDFCDLHSFLLKKMDDGLTAFTACEVAIFPHANLREITRKFPYLTRVLWATTLIDGAVQREWMLGLGRLSAQERVAHLICELFVRLRAVGMTEEAGYTLPITQQELGDIFGISAVHVNRTLQVLRSEGLIELDGRRMTILDWDGLRTLAHFNSDYLHMHQQIERD